MLFSKFVDILDKLTKKSGRIEMAEILSNMFKQSSPEEVQKEIYLLQGILAPPYKNVVLGLGDRFSLDVISATTGYDLKYVEKVYKECGDIGETAFRLSKNKKQVVLFSSELTVADVYDTFIKIASLQGERSQLLKKRVLSNLLNNSSPMESKFIMRFVVGELRLGVGNATIIDALSICLGNRELKSVIERAFNLCDDLGYVGRLCFEDFDKVRNFSLSVFTPLRPALAERLRSEEEIIKKLGGKGAVEYKFDGFRMQIHKKGRKVRIFSRRLEDITYMCPDIKEFTSSLPINEIIFEGEALAFNKAKSRFFSFQETMHRRRKYGIKEASQQYPLYLYVFDIMYLNGNTLIDLPYIERRSILEKIFPYKHLKLSEKWIVEDARSIHKKFSESISKGLEGIMVKDLNAPYTAGARKFAWIKLKKSYGTAVDTIDAVIVGYYFGKGSRHEFGLGGLLVAVYNPDLDRYETIAKVGSGYSEEDLKKLKSMLEKIKIKKPVPNLSYLIGPDVWVLPKYVVEVAFDNITKSSVHTCCEKDGKGFALRFPRLVRIREDKSKEDITTSNEIFEMYLNQF